MKTTPIIPWLGGKRRLASQLIPKFPEHRCYVELFCGGAALYFLRPEPAKVEVINDINSDLVNLYRVVQNHLDEFVRQFRWAITSREVFKWLQQAHCPGLTDIQRAARFFYLQQHAFGAKVAGQSFGTATTARSPNLLRVEEALSDAHIRLAGTYIEHLPWYDCFKKYDRPHTFFYCDPPYWQLAGYGNEFPLDQYQLLAEVMRHAQGKIMVSINDHPDMREIFDGFRIEKLNIRYSVGNSQTSPKDSFEMVVMNW